MNIEFTPELIAGLVGAALSWIFGWFPGLRTWFAALKSEIKSAIMLGLLAIASVVVYLLVYYGVLQAGEPITIWRLLSVFFFASTINQTMYSLTPQAKDVIEIKEAKG
mgnify:FL=1